ncbi:MAG: anaerobic ribonucleoside-triphosphate reductase activating protein, partial [Kiritimatiellae bacterium]|nr:anaerobic ribonucleoside-triphosphate reductase activating protein [Kiritimatiellia bacterium]
FLRAVKSLGLDVKLDTNGSRPEVLSRLLDERLVDAFAMDIKAPWERYDALTGVTCDVLALRRSLKLIADSGLPHTFRSTRVAPLLSEDDCHAIERQVPHGSSHRWQSFRPEHSLDPRLRTAADQQLARGGKAVQRVRL